MPTNSKGERDWGGRLRISFEYPALPASDRTEKDNIPVPAKLVERVSKELITRGEFIVFTFLLEQTYNLNRSEAELSYSDLSEGTKISAEHATASLKRLKARGIIRIEPITKEVARTSG